MFYVTCITSIRIQLPLPKMSNTYVVVFDNVGKNFYVPKQVLEKQDLFMTIIDNIDGLEAVELFDKIRVKTTLGVARSMVVIKEIIDFTNSIAAFVNVV